MYPEKIDSSIPAPPALLVFQYGVAMALPSKITQSGFPKITEEGISWKKAGTAATANRSHFNPFTPELPVQIHVPSTACDIIGFNGQGQPCSLTCAVIKGIFQNDTRMSTIQSRTPENYHPLILRS